MLVVRQEDLYLDRPVAVAGVVLSGQSNDETSPKTGGNTEEEVPVLDNSVRLIREDAREFAGQSKPTDDKYDLQEMRSWVGQAIKVRSRLSHSYERGIHRSWIWFWVLILYAASKFILR